MLKKGLSGLQRVLGSQPPITNKDEIRQECDSIPLKSYRRIEVEKDNTKLAFWVDEETKKTVCIVKDPAYSPSSMKTLRTSSDITQSIGIFESIVFISKILCEICAAINALDVLQSELDIIHNPDSNVNIQLIQEHKLSDSNIPQKELYKISFSKDDKEVVLWMDPQTNKLYQSKAKKPIIQPSVKPTIKPVTTEPIMQPIVRPTAKPPTNKPQITVYTSQCSKDTDCAGVIKYSCNEQKNPIRITNTYKCENSKCKLSSIQSTTLDICKENEYCEEGNRTCLPLIIEVKEVEDNFNATEDIGELTIVEVTTPPEGNGSKCWYGGWTKPLGHPDREKYLVDCR